MVLVMARPKNGKSTIWPGMCKRDAARKSTLKVNILQVFTIDFSEIQFIVNHNSKSDGQYRSAKQGDEVAQEDHTYRLTPEEKKRYQGQWYLNRAGKNGLMKLRSDFRAAVSIKNRLHHESGEQVDEPIHPDQSDDGITLQARRGGTSLNGIGNEFIQLYNWSEFFLFQLVSFTVDGDPL